MFAIAYQKLPFGSAIYGDKFYSKVINGDFNGFFKMHKVDADQPFGLNELIWDCLNPIPALRPTMKQIKLYTFVSDVEALSEEVIA